MAYPYRHPSEVRLLSEHFGDPEARSLASWQARGGYKGLKRALELGREKVIDEVKASGLRGRGGAGFPTGVKWGFMPKNSGKPHYLCCNADESEPGTFKDRELIRWTPHQLIEGCLIGAYAIGAQHAYIYLRGEFFEATQVLAKAVEEAYAAGLAGEDVLGSGERLDVTLHVGAGAYICGEETGLMNSLEGRRGQPRVKPPFPAAVGAFGMPTTINNVETLCAVPHIVLNGGAWYRQWGTEKSPGTKLFCVSGHVKRPGNYELPLGFPLMDLINDVCGGMREGRTLKAVIPGGSSVPLMNVDDCQTCALDYEGVAACGSMLGCASVIIMDDSTDIVRQVRRMVQFYAHESCGQCTPCRVGTEKMLAMLERDDWDVTALRQLSQVMMDASICGLGQAAPNPVLGVLEHFPDRLAAQGIRLVTEGVQ